MIHAYNRSDLPPQDQLIVLDGSQYPALAKNEKGLKTATSAAERVVIPCLRMIPVEGAANALRTDRSPTARVVVYMAMRVGTEQGSLVAY